VKRIKWLGIFLILPSLVSAQEGKLPRKQKKKKQAIESLESKYSKTKSKATAGSSTEEKTPNLQVSHCGNSISSAIQERVVQDEKYIYYLARMKSTGSKPNQGFLYSLLALEKSKRGAKITKLFSLEGPLHMGLVFHSDSGSGFSTIAFRGPENGCGSGMGVGTSIPYFANRNKQPKPTSALPSGNYSLVRSGLGKFIAAFDRRQVISMDPASSQKRTIGKFSKGEYPISYDSDRRILYVWQTTYKTLAALPGLTKNVVSSYKLLTGEKLLVDGYRFAVITPTDSKTSFMIEELDRSLQKIATKRMYQITLPSGLPARNLRFALSIESQTLVVYNSSANAGSGRVLIYDYASGKLKSDLQVKPGKFVDQIVFNEVSKTVKKSSVLVFLNNRADKTLNKILVFQDNWNSIPF